MDATDTQTFVCSVEGCHKSFRRKNRLDIHTRIHTGERPFKCHFDSCQSSYARSQHLSRHIDRVHTDHSKKASLKVRCPECDVEFADKFCLQNHKKRLHHSSTDNKPYKCPEELCDQSFHKKKQLVVHRLEHVNHLSVAAKCYSCPHEGCTKTFMFPNRLKRHLKVHAGYPCDKDGCDQVLPNWSALRKHKAVEHAPALSCNLCDKSFKQKSNLKQHLQVHTEREKVFTCPREDCDRTFLYNKNLTQHIRAFHEGESIWKSRKKHVLSSQKKRKHTKRKTMASRLCGIKDNPKQDGDRVVQQRENENNNLMSAEVGQQIDEEPEIMNEKTLDVHIPNTSVSVSEISAQDQSHTVIESPETTPSNIQTNIGCEDSADVMKLKSRPVTIIIENEDRSREEVVVTVIS